MWRMGDGDRVLTEAEWALFATGLYSLRDLVEEDIASESDCAQTGVVAFDHLTPEQKLALLAGVADALRDPTIPTPVHTAANEGAIKAVFSTLRTELEMELHISEVGDPSLEVRRLLLAVCADSEGREEPLPDSNSMDSEPWNWLVEEVEERVFWDCDFEMGDEFLDLPPEEARKLLQLSGIDPEYFLAVPDEPDERGLTAARRTLARLLGLPVPDEDGHYPAIDDLYHHLEVGPCSPAEIAAWEENPWVQVIGMSEPGWDCDYSTWVERFSAAMPTAPFELNPIPPDAMQEMPRGTSVERLGNGWVVRDESGAYWCGLIENDWISDPDDEDMPSLTFPTEAEARAAFIHAHGMYAERALRHQQAMATISERQE